MILTPIVPRRLPERMAALERGLTADWTRQVLQRIARGGDGRRATGVDAARHHGDACALLRQLGMAIRDGAPSLDVSWNGSAVRGATEAYVLLHEGAHFQLAAPQRRRLIDFGLGPGPETGDKAAALRAQRLHGTAGEREEARASLLGILWEIELGHPGLASFLDQNWLEGAERLGTGAHFTAVLTALRDGGFIDAAGRPRPHLRETADGDQESALRGPAK
ncbi:MAG TPA: hypothetical protein VGU20_13245 [Stellaceae bacterium]|nr:hypothetical protein [Stellaceae bacterium]